MPRTSRVRHTPIEQLAPALPVRDAVVFPGQIHTLHVAREGSKRSVRLALHESKTLFVVSQRDQTVEDPSPADLNRIGTLCEPLQAVPLPDGSLRVALRCLKRGEALRFNRRGGHLSVAYVELAETGETTLETEALMRECVQAFGDLIQMGKSIPPEAMETVGNQAIPGALSDAIAHHLPIPAGDKQRLLEELDTTERISAVHEILKKEQKLLQIQSEISKRVDTEFATTQREYFLREQLRAIQSELAAMGADDMEAAQVRQAIEAAQMPEHAKLKALEELTRLERCAPHSPEAMVVRNYLDWMTRLPWSRLSPDRLDIRFARQILDEAHYGLEQVKERILDFLAVRQVSQSLRGPILCFVGPPGVGKTSAGKSIADALGREFARISLGGLRDEAEIRGHRRTYVGALPGKILQCLRQCGTRNPVIVLDEIDKMASDWRGDPSSALLEALDPAQNERFSDHFLEVPFDLSSVIFIATANLTDNIPHALRDRMEMVRFSSYTDEERLEIAGRFIVPRQMALHGLGPESMSLPKSTLEVMVRDYAREAGVRELERLVGAACRKVARSKAEGSGSAVLITPHRLRGLIGPPRLTQTARVSAGEIGAANSMVVTQFGGEVIPIEVLLLPGVRDTQTLKLTGNMGAVMQESAEAALSYVRAQWTQSLPGSTGFSDVHIHVPDNAVPKEGPSAGLTIAIALASAMTNRKVRNDLAVTGEITLLGKVLPVGGIREKLVAAHRAGLRTVIVPAANEVDLIDVPKSVRSRLKVHLVETIDAALEFALVPQPTSAVVRGAASAH